MNTFTIAVFCVVVATASAGHLGYGYLDHAVPVVAHHINPEAHIASGSVGVSHDGVVIAGPSGSIHTNNGIHGHAGAQISGPAGDIGTHGGHARLTGPGHDHYGHYDHHDHHAVYAAPVYTAHVAPLAHHVYAAPVHGAFDHHGYGYGHGYGHGLVGYGHGW